MTCKKLTSAALRELEAHRKWWHTGV